MTNIQFQQQKSHLLTLLSVDLKYEVIYFKNYSILFRKIRIKILGVLSYKYL